MSHLGSDTLARLGSEEPSPEEQAHLEACTQCAFAVEHFRRQRAALAALPRLPAPPDAWPEIAARLADSFEARRWTVGQRLSVAAAAVVVFATGISVGVGAVDWSRSRTPSTVAGSNHVLARDARQAVTQLAALESILLTTEAAMRDAPEDPLLSRYRTTALRERQSLLAHVRLVSSRTWY